jgi:hypothetical protein
MNTTNQLPELLLEFDEWQRNTPRKLPEHLTNILRSALQARAQVQGELSVDRMREMLSVHKLAIVPMRATHAMLDAMSDDDWQWSDLLAAAEAITEDEHDWIDATPRPAQATQAEVTDGIRPEDFTVDVVAKSMGGFAQINTQGVRVTHKPTGISVTCDAARSQHTNRHQALETLRTVLAQQPDNAACKSVKKRLEAQQPATGDPAVWNSIQIASWIGSQLMHEPSMFERAAVCKFVRSLGRHPTLLKHSR